MSLSVDTPLPPRIVAELRAIVGNEYVLTDIEDRLAYSIDGTWAEQQPHVVLLPATTREVALIVQIAAREGIPITARGSSSGLSGGSIPEHGGISLAMTRMRKIIDISVEDQVAVVQPGIITAELQRAVERVGLFYPPDPSSLTVSAIGGNIAENAGGARCLKYGVTGDYVMGLEIVLPSGEIIRTGGRMVKNVTGYNLRALFVGSEGTLGVITEATLRLIPRPRHTLTMLASFAQIADAACATTSIMAEGHLPTSIELMDAMTIDCVRQLQPDVPLSTDADAILLIAVDGNNVSLLQDELSDIAAICKRRGATGTVIAGNANESERIWQARRAIAPALARQRPHRLGEDISVPRSQIPAMVQAISQIATRYNLQIPLFGHAGDGNLHPNILCDQRDPEEMERVWQAAAAIFEAAIEYGGTLSGEHGIGLLKREFMKQDLGAVQLAAMLAIKKALDPQNIMNPGKIFPAESFQSIDESKTTE
jgi:glycolate oxidase